MTCIIGDRQENPISEILSRFSMNFVKSTYCMVDSDSENEFSSE